MASIEFIISRIEGKEKEIAKLTSKMDRILKAKATNWEVNPYWYNENDINRTQRELDAANAALEGYKDQLIKEQDKAASRNIQVIIDFLDTWKSRVRSYHIYSLPRFIEARSAYYKINSEYCDWFNSRARIEATPEEYKQRREAERKAEKKFQSDWSWFTPYVDREDGKDVINITKLNKDLDKEADAKYDDIVNRTIELVGKIIDASNLSIGMKGDLNGVIEGEKGKAKVETIGAGGYNIQCFHFRTLIHLLSK